MKLLILLLPFLLVGCIDDTTNNTATYEGAAIVTVGADASDIAIIDTEFEITESLYPQAFTDVKLSKGTHSLYALNRYNQNNIVKFNNENVGESVWQYSTEGDEASQSNPHGLIEVSENKAYILRYGSANIWVVNPSAESEEDFKISEIDLSQFDSSDNIPEMVTGFIYQNTLYVILQRLTNFKANQSAQLIAINVNNNEFIDLNPADTESVAYTLLVRNPKDISLNSDQLFINGVGKYATKDWNTGEILSPIEYTGGIEKLSLSSLSSELIVDDGDSGNHPYGQVYTVSSYSDSVLFNGYSGWGSLSVYLKDSENEPSILNNSLMDVDVRFSEFDIEGRIWIGIASDSEPRVEIYEKDEESHYQLTRTIYTTLSPNSIIFN